MYRHEAMLGELTATAAGAECALTRRERDSKIPPVLKILRLVGRFTPSRSYVIKSSIRLITLSRMNVCMYADAPPCSIFTSVELADGIISALAKPRRFSFGWCLKSVPKG